MLYELFFSHQTFKMKFYVLMYDELSIPAIDNVSYPIFYKFM